MNEPDKYDRAIEYLTNRPDEIQRAWQNPTHNKGGDLFRFCTSSGNPFDVDSNMCGCITQVAHNRCFAETEPLTKAIREDARIPEAGEITAAHLPIFAEWQRRIDKELGQV